MFQIFAARMFEQRVLIAYREKVARERQEKLLEELADESRLDEQREAKKVRDAIKKKEKKNKQKVVKEEEKLKREAEKAEQEATERLAEEKKLEEQRARKEAQRKKRETEKQAQEAERQKKESDRLRKLQEAKDQQAEQERKQRENKEREKRRKDEAKKKEHDEKEAREREQRDRDILAKSETNAKEAQEREIRERSRRQDTVRSIGHTTPVPIPLARKASSNAAMSSGLNSMATSAPSPHLQIATPSIPKAPTPNRARQASRQGSIQSSPKSTTQPASSTATSPSSTNIPPPLSIAQPVIKQIQPQAVMNNSIPMAPPPGMNHSLGAMSPPPGLNSPAFTPGFGPIYTNGLHPRGPVGHDIGAFSQQQPINSPMYRGFINTPSIVGFPPGINAVPRQTVPCRVPLGEIPVTQTPIGTGVTPGLAQPTSHSRNASASFDIPAQIQPIGRPAANMRMSMCTTRPDVLKHEADDLSKHLGSSALLDDTEDTLEPTMDRPHLGTGGHRPSRLGFGGPQIFPEAINCKFILLYICQMEPILTLLFFSCKE